MSLLQAAYNFQLIFSPLKKSISIFENVKRKKLSRVHQDFFVLKRGREKDSGQPGLSDTIHWVMCCKR